MTEKKRKSRKRSRIEVQPDPAPTAPVPVQTEEPAPGKRRGPKLSKFNLMFGEPVCMSDGVYALSMELFPTETDALAEYRSWGGNAVWDEKSLEHEWVRFQFPPTEHHIDYGGRPAWFTGAWQGRGAKPVWLLKTVEGSPEPCPVPIDEPVPPPPWQRRRELEAQGQLRLL